MNRSSYPSYPPPQSVPNQPVAAAQQQYYVFSADNNHVGPVSAELIARGVAAGKVQNDALVAPVGTSQWVSLTAIPELAAALAIHAPHHSSMRPASQPGTLLVAQAPQVSAFGAGVPQAPRLPQELLTAPVAPPVVEAVPAPVASPLEVPPPKAEEKKPPLLDPRYKLLPLAIFGCFAFLGVIETAIALIVMK